MHPTQQRQAAPGSYAQSATASSAQDLASAALQATSGQKSISKLMDKVGKLESEIQALEQETDAYTAEGDQLEKKLTELTIQASLSSRQRKELSKRENGQITQALKLLASQMETLEEEITFLKSKNDRLQQEISGMVDEHRSRKADLVRKLETEQAEAQKHSLEAQGLQEELDKANKTVGELKEQLDAKSGEKRQVQAAIESLTSLDRECKDLYAQQSQKQDPELLQSLLGEVGEIRGDIVKLLVQAFENPVRFAESTSQEEYKTLLSRLARKKAQIRLVQQRFPGGM